MKFIGSLNEVNATLEGFHKYLNWHKLAFSEWREYVIFKFVESRSSNASNSQVANHYSTLEIVLTSYETKITCMLDSLEMCSLRTDIQFYVESLRKAIILTVIKPLVTPPPTVSLLCDNVEANSKALTPKQFKKLPTINEEQLLQEEPVMLSIASLNKEPKKRKAKDAGGTKDDESVASSTASTGRSTRRKSAIMQ